MGVLNSCVPRPEVMASDLADAMFAASLGAVVSGTAERVYADPRTFFDNTHPAVQLKKIVEVVFDRLNNPNESGAVIRISTGFGGGKTHALVSLYHIAKNVTDFSLGTDLAPAAKRPSKVSVAAIDAEGAGVPAFRSHKDATTHSLAGELAYQLGGKEALNALGAADSPTGSPNEDQIRAMLPEGPTLILLDEIVVYLAKLDERGQGNVIGFISALAKEVLGKRQAVLVISDPASQQAYAAQTHLMDQALREAATKLEQVLGRKFSDFDPIKDEAAQVIARRLFTQIDPVAADAASATYRKLYERVRSDHPNQLPSNVLAPDEIAKFVRCYPFHPRLLETAQNRLSAIPDYNKGRGTLRLFARLLRDIWERGEDVELISAGEVNWASDRIQADLLQRLNRDQFAGAVNADVIQHAGELDGGARGHHARAASALLLESLPQDSQAAMTPQDLTYAILRPEDAGEEPAEALDRLLNVCWYTYPSETGDRFQFRVEPNVIKQVEERAQAISTEDARDQVRTRVGGFYRGTYFQLCLWPEDITAVPRTIKPLLVLCDRELLGRDIAKFESIDPEGHKSPRELVNNIGVLVPEASLFASAIERAKRLKAAEAIKAEATQGVGNPLALKQLDKFLPSWSKHFRIEAVRAFTRLILHGGEHRIGEEILASDDTCAKPSEGQINLKEFLERKNLLYKPHDALDVELFKKKVFESTPDHQGQAGVKTAAALLHRMLAVHGFRLVGEGAVVRETLKKAVAEGPLVVRLPDMRCFDAQGCVAGVEGKRRREPFTLTTLALQEDVLVASPASPVAQSWFITDDPAPTNGDIDEEILPPPPILDENTATTWEDASEKAATKRVCSVKLISSTPAGLSAFAGVSYHLSPNEQKLTLRVSGYAKEGGTMNLAFTNLKPGHPIKPATIAAQIFNALTAEGRSAKFVLENTFHNGREGMEDRIARAQEAVEGLNLRQEIQIEVKFE